MKSCCCCGFELRGGSIASACYTLVSALFSLGFLSYKMHQVKQYRVDYLYGNSSHEEYERANSWNEWNVYIFASAIVFQSLIVLASVLLFAGVNKKRAGLIVPWVVMVIIKVVLAFLTLLGAIITMIVQRENNMLPAGLFSAAFIIGIICLDSYCIACVCAYRKEMISERLANSRATGCVTEGGISMDSKIYKPYEAMTAAAGQCSTPLLIISPDLPPAYARVCS